MILEHEKGSGWYMQLHYAYYQDSEHWLSDWYLYTRDNKLFVRPVLNE